MILAITVLKINWQDKALYLKQLRSDGKPRLGLSVLFSGAIFKGENIMFILPDDKTATVLVSAVDAKGFPAPIESVTYSSSDEKVVTVDVDGVVTPTGVGSATVNVTADAQIGEGVDTLVGLLELQVVAGKAVSLGVVAVLN